MTVLELLEEIEDIVDTAPGLPLTGKIMVDANELLQIVRDIRLGLPDDVQQAKWVKDEKERILGEAKAEYEKIIVEAKKQADYLVETDDITLRAQRLGEEIQQNAENYARELKMRTYDYVDKMLYDMEGRMEDLNLKYFGEMYASLEKTFAEIGGVLQANREEIKGMAYRTKNGEDGVMTRGSLPNEE